MNTPTRRALGALIAAAVTVGLAGCASAAPTASPTSTATKDSLEGSITVFAAASLKGTFTELAEWFEAAHPATRVELNFAGSADLVTQITEGAPADVFASADEKNMAKLTDAGLIDGEPVDFATNVLQIAVPPADPAGIKTFADLAAPGLKVVICAPEVPCGAATVKVVEVSGIALAPVSEESSVTDVLGKVTSGQADAGLVYVTDVIAAGDAVEGVAFDESAEAVNTYPIAALADAEASDVAAAFVAFLTSEAGQSVLTAAGFGKP
ncbi:molybdate ABC transporter substrate-binding protein [Microbacterium sp.]|uniref:molybdate ABC transporter substrate-binding protein n=1 Tax=Microbacterium sp. TaxID=51671 RepID=UPI003C15AEE7